MPLNDEVKALLGDKINEGQIIEMLIPDVTAKLGENHVIRTKEDDESFVSLKAKELKDAEIGSHVGALYQGIEDKVNALGYKKNSNEKATDYLGRVLGELKIKADQAGGGDEVLKQQIATLTKSIEEIEASKTTELTALEQKYFRKEVDSELGTALASVTLAFPATVKTDAEKQAFTEQQRKLLKLQIANDYTIKMDNDGNVVFYKGDALQSSAKDGKPLTASDIIARDFATYIDVAGKQIGGAGSSGSGQKGSFQTKKEVYDHLKANGYEEGSNRLTQEAMKLIKEHGILS